MKRPGPTPDPSSVTLIGDGGSYDTHFDIVTRSGVKLRVELEVLP